MLNRLESIEKRYKELSDLIAQPDISTDPAKLQPLAQEHANLDEIVTKYRKYKSISQSITETQGMLDDGLDPEMVHMVKEELENLKKVQNHMLEELKLSLLPKDTNETRDAIVEIRAGTGGGEAALFAADLFRMYSRYAQRKGWQVEIIDMNPTEIGGFKEIVFEVKGKGAFSHLKYERGVHRVQRVPKTEASGRIHTSTATVAVLAEAEEIDIAINPEDI